MTATSSRPTIAFGAIFAASACATVHPGHPGVSVDDRGRATGRLETPSGVRISARELDTLAAETLGTLEITFENTSPHWLRIQEIDLDFGSPGTNQNIAILGGDDLYAWTEGAQLRAARREQNADAAVLAVALGGLFLGMAGGISDNPGLALAGDLAVVGSMSVAAARDIDRHVEAAQSVHPYPQNHLYALPFSVPPGLAVKKFVVLDTSGVPRGSCLSWVYLGYRTIEGKRERVVVGFRYPGDDSDWKAGICS